MCIGENIRNERKKAGLTQLDLAKKLGVKQATISAFENDKTNIKYSTLHRIAKALDTYVFYLLDGDKLMYERLYDSYIKNDKDIQILRACLSSIYLESDIVFDDDTSNYVIKWCDCYDPLLDPGENLSDYHFDEITLNEAETIKLVNDMKDFFKYKLYELRK